MRTKPDLISISGKKHSGKDTVGKIIQFLIANKGKSLGEITDSCIKFIESNGTLMYPEETDWQIKKFADKTKEVLSLFFGFTKEQLEDQHFKDKPIHELTKYKVNRIDGSYTEFTKISEARDYAYSIYGEDFHEYFETVMFTPRLLMQQIATKCFRNTIHEDFHIVGLFSDWVYKYDPLVKDLGNGITLTANVVRGGRKHLDNKHKNNWLITDARHLNEIYEIEVRNGFKIKIIRLRTSEDWESDISDYCDIESHEGWDNNNFKFSWYEEKISVTEFISRLQKSKYSGNVNFESWLTSASHESEWQFEKYENFDWVLINSGSLRDLVGDTYVMLKSIELI